MKKNWYAVYTKSSCEKKVASLLAKKKIEHYCPLNRLVSPSVDRKKLIFEPLFKSFVFVRSTEEQMSDIRKTNDVVNFVYWLDSPAVIKDVEIESMQHFLDQHSSVSLERIVVNNNEMVRITSGPMLESDGNSLAVNSNKVKVSLPSLGYAISAEVRKSQVEVLDYSFQLKNKVS